MIDYRVTAVIEPITTEGEFGIKKDNKLTKYWRRGSEYYKQPNGEGSWEEITEDEFNRAWAVFYWCLNYVDTISQS